MSTQYERELSNGRKIPILGLGTWHLSGSECVYAVKKALGLGYCHIDTAEMYGNQREIGEAIKGFDRSMIFLTSKVWSNHLRYDDLLDACDRTLRELDTDYLDLYLVHWPNSSVPLKETLKALGELVSEGKVRSIGVSNFYTNLLREALNTSDVPVTVDQVRFYPSSYDGELLEFCSSNRVVVTAYSPLGRGTVTSYSIIVEMAKKYGRTPAQVCLRWCLQKGAIVIPKARSEEHLRENMGIFDWKISDEDMKRIDSLI